MTGEPVRVPRQVPIPSWPSLCEKIFEYRKSGYWLFRGVSTAEYSLTPKIGREGARKDIGTGNSLPYSRSEERLALDYFMRTARPYLTHRPETEIEWLAVAQHHGMATRLLDWTESLLVAAFFAIQSAKVGKFPAIHAIKNVPLVPRDKYSDLDALDDVMRFPAPYQRTHPSAAQRLYRPQGPGPAISPR